MIAWQHFSVLLAQRSNWQRMGDGLHRHRSRGEFSDLVPYIIGMAVIGACIAIGMAIAKRNDMSQSCNDPGKLFRELCRAHKLSFSSQRLLRRLAAAMGLETPAAVFLTPAAFDVGRLPPHLQSEAVKIQLLRRRLF